MLKRIYAELIAIKKELQAIRNDLEREYSINISNGNTYDLIIKDDHDRKSCD